MVETDLGTATILYEAPNEGSVEETVDNEHIARVLDHPRYRNCGSTISIETPAAGFYALNGESVLCFPVNQSKPDITCLIATDK